MPDASVIQTALSPAGPQSAHISHLWWLMFWVCTAIFALVMAALAVAVRRRRDRSEHRPPEAPLQPTAAGESALGRGVAIAIGISAVTLFVLLVDSIWTGRAVASLGASSAVTIKLTGHQWWWEAEYEEAVPSRRVRTANEIHIPIGRPVVLKVTSHDVIHSVWIPNLQGKRDLIPGYTTAIWIQADRPGVYRGQCAEFCGYQHAHMALYVTAEDGAQFERWLADQREPAVDPAGDRERHGRDVFLSTTCAQCHTIRGTVAGATLGPDLTHLATRGTIAAGTLQNTSADLSHWVLDPQGIKPGNRMPPSRLADEDLQGLLAYLGSLK